MKYFGWKLNFLLEFHITYVLITGAGVVMAKIAGAIGVTGAPGTAAGAIGTTAGATETSAGVTTVAVLFAPDTTAGAVSVLFAPGTTAGAVTVMFAPGTTAGAVSVLFAPGTTAGAVSVLFAPDTIAGAVPVVFDPGTTASGVTGADVFVTAGVAGVKMGAVPLTGVAGKAVPLFGTVAFTEKNVVLGYFNSKLFNHKLFKQCTFEVVAEKSKVEAWGYQKPNKTNQII